MRRSFVTADVFTDRLFGGNPVAVVLDAEGLSTEAMQAIASEFNLSETTFVLPPRDPTHTAHVRIFTPRVEVPFAGHPNVGTAFVLARRMAERGEAVPDRLVFEEAAGLVPVRLTRDGGAVVGAELAAPEPLSRRSRLAPEAAAALLALRPEDVRTDAHPPEVVSVGLPFLVVELASRGALRRARPDLAAYAAHLPLDGADAVYAYTRDVGGEAAEAGTDLQARMFAPLDGILEDPATGSATAATVALFADVRGAPELALRVGQGVDMGRPSLLPARARREGGAAAAFVGGRCVGAMEGSFKLDGRGNDAPRSASGTPVQKGRPPGSLPRTALGGAGIALVFGAVATRLMPDQEILMVGAVVSAIAIGVAFSKLVVNAYPGRRWTDHLKILTEAGALAAARLFLRSLIASSLASPFASKDAGSNGGSRPKPDLHGRASYFAQMTWTLRFSPCSAAPRPARRRPAWAGGSWGNRGGSAGRARTSPREPGRAAPERRAPAPDSRAGTPTTMDLLRFSGEASGQSAADFSNRFGLVKSRAEWRLTGL